MKSILLVLGLASTFLLTHKADAGNCNSQINSVAQALANQRWAQQNLPPSQIGPYIAAVQQAMQQLQVCRNLGD